MTNIFDHLCLPETVLIMNFALSFHFVCTFYANSEAFKKEHLH